MERIEWDPAMDTGDRLVDGQHRALVGLFNELVVAEVSEDGALGVAEVLERLTEYVLVHFSAEEGMMAESAYPEGAKSAHLEQHKQLTETTRSLVLDYRTGVVSSTVPIVDVLYKWLREHVDRCDRALIEHVRLGGTGR